MKYNMLRAKMAEHEYSQAALAQEIGISVQSMNAKLNGHKQFKLQELKAICEVLKIQPNKIAIFFDVGA